MPDPVVAEQLSRALAGETTGIPEADDLAELLRRAAASTRFEVTAAETESALAVISHRKRRRPRPPGWLAAAAGGVAFGLLLVLVLPATRAPGLNIEGRALAAVRRAGPITVLETRTVESAGGEPVLRTQWVVPDGRTRVRTVVHGAVVQDIVREPGGRVIEYAGGGRRVVVAPSCHAIAGTCSELVDPIAFYRDRLAAGGVTGVQPIVFGGRRAYRFSLPAQVLRPGTTRITQVVTVDAATYLPRRIVWDQTVHGRTTAAAVIDVLRVISLLAPPPQVFHISRPAQARIVQVDASGARLIGRPSVSVLPLGRARSLFPDAFWVGRRYHGLRLTGVHELRWPTGRALRLDYGPLTIWSFDRVIPPPLLEGRLLPAKTLDFRNLVARFYVAADGKLVAERDVPGGSVAAVAPGLEKLQMVDVITAARRLG